MMLDELIENHEFVLTIDDEFEQYLERDEQFLNNQTNYNRYTMGKENQ